MLLILDLFHCLSCSPFPFVLSLLINCTFMLSVFLSLLLLCFCFLSCFSVAMMWAKHRGAARVIGIDNDPFRLQFVMQKLGVETINFGEHDVIPKLKEMLPERGPDVCIDCVGFRFAKSLSQRLQRSLKLETDATDILNEMIVAARKCGRLSIIGVLQRFLSSMPFSQSRVVLSFLAGDYFAFANQLHIVAFMEKVKFAFLAVVCSLSASLFLFRLSLSSFLCSQWL